MILHDKNRNKNKLCHFLSFCCAPSVLFNASVVIKISLFYFRPNGLKSNYFCGELSHVSVLIAILCLSDFTTSAIIHLLLLRANISHGKFGNQHDFLIMRNLFYFRFNGRKSNYFCGELSYVSVLLAILCFSVLLYHKRYYTAFIAAC